jgi:beta-lactamase class A
MSPVRVVPAGLLALFAASLLGCAVGAGRPAPQGAASPAPSAASLAPVAIPPRAAGVPDTPAGRQLAWVLAELNGAPAEGDIAPHFSEAFLARVPPAKLAAVTAQVARGAPYALEKVTPSEGSDRSLVALVRARQGQAFSVHLSVEAKGDRIDRLLIRPHLDTTVANSWEDVAAGLRAAAPSVNFLAAELDGRKCVTVSSIDPQKPLALGSAFKLYVLDALATQIASGRHGWDDSIAIDDLHKSLPSGEMRNEPAGKLFSVRHFAEQMISVSDNTAADHLAAWVGRGAVEDAVKASGHATPSLLVPFLSTREMFAIKLLASPDERRAYLAADPARRRKLLDAYDRRTPEEMMARASSFNTPIAIDSLEWFASADDLCKIMVDLHQWAEATVTAPIGTILSINPGIPDEKGQYRYVGFKGGSEPGVLNVTFLLQRARDGAWLFLTAGFNDATKNVDETRALSAAATALEFFGR